MFHSVVPIRNAPSPLVVGSPLSRSSLFGSVQCRTTLSQLPAVFIPGFVSREGWPAEGWQISSPSDDVNGSRRFQPVSTHRGNREMSARRGYLFSVRSAAVLGSSNVSTPKTKELYQISPALEPAAPETGALR